MKMTWDFAAKFADAFRRQHTDVIVFVAQGLRHPELVVRVGAYRASCEIRLFKNTFQIYHFLTEAVRRMKLKAAQVDVELSNRLCRYPAYINQLGDTK